MNTAHLLFSDSVARFAGMDLFDKSDFMELVVRFSLNLIVILLLVRWLYYSVAKRKDYLFTYILISCIVFLLCYLLESVKLQIGFALGLFAIFGIIRYRTDSMPIKEMTYLFLVIGVSVINALTNKKTSIIEVLFTNAAIVFITYGLEKVWLLKHESSREVVYEKIDLIKPERYDEMMADLRHRTGIQNISRVEIGKIDFLKDTCRMMVFFEDREQMINEADKADRTKNGSDYE